MVESREFRHMGSPVIERLEAPKHMWSIGSGAEGLDTTMLPGCLAIN